MFSRLLVPFLCFDSDGSVVCVHLYATTTQKDNFAETIFMRENNGNTAITVV